MKTILKIFYMFIACSATSQVTQILPLHSFDYPNGTYLKDLDNELPYFVGTWVGEVNNIQYTFEFTLFTQVEKTYKNDIYEYRDELMGKFKAMDIVSNQVLYDNLEATDIEDYTISEIFIRDQIEFEFLFMDTEDNCFNQAGFKLIRNINNTSQLMYEDFELGDYGSFYDCNNYQNQSEIPMYLPSENLILIKQ